MHTFRSYIHTGVHTYIHTYIHKQHNGIHVAVRGAAYAHVRLCTLLDAYVNESLGFEGLSEDEISNSFASEDNDPPIRDLLNRTFEESLTVKMGAFCLGEVCLCGFVLVC